METSVGDLSAHLEDNWKGGIGSIFHHIDNRVVERVLVLLQPVGQVVVDGARVVDHCKVRVLVCPSCNVLNIAFVFPHFKKIYLSTPLALASGRWGSCPGGSPLASLQTSCLSPAKSSH